MALDVGLWIDHRKAVIVLLNGKAEDVVQLDSGLASHTRYRGPIRPKTPYSAQYQHGDDQLDRQYIEHVNKFYEKVIPYVRDADSVLILGPGEAKSEFQKRLTQGKIGVRIAAIETAGRMTVRQISAKVRDFFHRRESGT
jgi:stalled ribosome rescue protein Dom34